jgi:hypothetical protein
MPSPKPRKISTIDGVKIALGKELTKQYGKGVRVEVSYRYERVPRERGVNGNGVGSALVKRLLESLKRR